MMDIDLLIDRSDENARLDQVVSGAVADCSRKRAAGLIQTGRIRVSGAVKKPAYKVRSGDRITGTIDLQTGVFPVLPEKIDLDILFADPHLIVINKPAGLVVHPGAGNESGTLVNGLLFHYPEIAGIGDDPIRPGIVHRLDKDTSGVMVAARTAHAFAFLQKEFMYRRVDKRYLALIAGNPGEAGGRMDRAMGRHPVKRTQMSVNSDALKPALTFWTVIERLGETTLVEARIKTGRTHQIRVHFHSYGYPIVGDPVYRHRRHRKEKQPVSRQMLHASAIRFKHPFSGRSCTFSADLPGDFSDLLDRLRRTAPV